MPSKIKETANGRLARSARCENVENAQGPRSKARQTDGKIDEQETTA